MPADQYIRPLQPQPIEQKETEQVEEIEEVTEKAEEIEIIEEIPNDDTHLIFNNVPINGTLKSYIAQMEKKGFKINGWANLTKEEEQEIKSKAYKVKR